MMSFDKDQYELWEGPKWPCFKSNMHCVASHDNETAVSKQNPLAAKKFASIAIS